MLGDITAATDIYIICGYTDMRKSIDGLCAIIRDQLHFEPEHTTALYLFCGRRNDRIKALLHENDGLCFYINASIITPENTGGHVTVTR